MPYRRYHHADPRRHITHLRLILGRRGAALAFLGVLWICTGLSTWLVPPSSSYLLLSDGEILRGGAWVATGIVALLHAPRRQGHDALGFLALYLMPAYRVIAYGLGFLDWVAHGVGGPGDPRGLVGVLAWLVVLVFVVLVAGWPEPHDDTEEPA